MKNIFSSFAGARFAPGLLQRDRDDRPYFFLICSAIIHILVFWMLTTFGAGPLKLFRVPVEPLFEIEIVELPDNFQGKLKIPDKVTALAQRSQEVEKEEYPKRSERLTSTPAVPAAVPSAIVIISPGGAGQGNSATMKAPVIKEIQAEVTDDGVKKKDDPYATTSLVPEILRPESRSKKNTGAGGGSIRLIPTKGSLQQIAHRENKVVDSPKEGSGMTLLLNTAEFKYQKYFMDVKKRIQFYWEYPALAARNGQQGRLSIDFVIHKDGLIETNKIDIIKSSNYPILDDSATTALRLASPFNPFPEGFDVEEITVHGSFEYSLIRGKR